MKIIDISRTVRTGMPVWPGDTPAQFEIKARIPEGSAVNIGALHMSIHAGTHVDAPWHYNDAGAHIDTVPLDVYAGPAVVIDARGAESLGRSLFDGIDLAPTPRVLFRTDAWKDANVFPSDWPTMEATLPGWLASHGVMLVGFDVPSVDKLESKDLPNHHACDRANLLILESTDLHRVEPGVYELVALPMRIAGGDGSPVRAVLRSVP